MNSLINATARHLAMGDPIVALKRVALRDDASGLALRGIAMAQLGELPRARALLQAAAKAFGPREALARARCVVAEAEIALVTRDLSWGARRLDAARTTLEAHGDVHNAWHARYLEVRHALLVGHLARARAGLARAPASLPVPLRIGHALIQSQIAMRQLRIGEARRALDRAGRLAASARIPALIAEVDATRALLQSPAARLLSGGAARVLRLDEVEKVLASRALIVDELRHVVRQGRRLVALTTRPVLRALARALADAWPGDVGRDVLMQRVFRLRLADESHRARLRVEMGRLRRVLAPLARIESTPDGYQLSPLSARAVQVLAPPDEGEHAEVMAFLADGEAWSTSALAEALGASQRTVQRSLEALLRAGRVQHLGRGRARRWLVPQVPGFTTLLLLPAALPGG